MTTDKITRRTLGGLAAAGVGVPLLAACSSDEPETAADPTGSPTSSSPSAASSSAGGESTSPSAAEELTTTSDIEVGGGAIFADEEVVVTQPTEGEFKGFSAICTHQGCLLASVSEGTINCDCHGSRFSIETGEPEEGSQATTPLGEVALTVSGDQISLA
jgi:Rieske Fe-S protein